MPLIFSEYNASYANEPNVTDTVYMAAWLATTISQCDGLTEAMSYWTFSDVFEEQGVVKTPFYGGFGLIAEDSIPKPALNAFAMLHELGDRRINSTPIRQSQQDEATVPSLWLSGTTHRPSARDQPTLRHQPTRDPTKPSL